MTDSSPSPRDGVAGSQSRWPFIRDVLVLQVKLFIGNLHNLVLVPATTVAAALDLLFKSDRHGSRFYRVLEWGRRADEAIGLYGALDRHEEKLKSELSVDALIYRVEQAILREHEKGGTAANVRAAVDRVLDGLQRRMDRGAIETPGASLRNEPDEGESQSEH